MKWLIERALRKLAAELPVQTLRGVVALLLVAGALLLVGPEVALKLFEWLSTTLGQVLPLPTPE